MIEYTLIYNRFFIYLRIINLYAFRFLSKVTMQQLRQNEIVHYLLNYNQVSTIYICIIIRSLGSGDSLEMRYFTELYFICFSKKRAVFLQLTTNRLIYFKNFMQIMDHKM